MQLLRVLACIGAMRRKVRALAALGCLQCPCELLGRLPRGAAHLPRGRRLLRHLLRLVLRRRPPALVGDVAKGDPARELRLLAGDRALRLPLLLLLLAQLGRVVPIVSDEQLLLQRIGVHREHRMHAAAPPRRSSLSPLAALLCDGHTADAEECNGESEPNSILI